MRKPIFASEQLLIAKNLLFWIVLLVPVSITIGLLVSLFLWLLEVITNARWQNLWLITFLPLAGVGIFFLYKAVGKNSDAGNNLIMDEIHEPGDGIPRRMTPLILFTTV